MSFPQHPMKPIKIIFPQGNIKHLKYNPYNKTYVKPKKTRIQNKPTRPLIHYSSLNDSDNTWIGDDLSSKPQQNHTRFWYQNCQGMVTTRDINQYHFEMQKYIDNNIHYLAFTETRINSSHTQTMYELEHGYTHLVTHGRIDLTNTPGFTSTGAFQPGGVAAAFQGRITNRYTKTIRDLAGRWIIHEFVGGKNRFESIHFIELIQNQVAQTFLHGLSRRSTFKNKTSMKIHVPM